MISRTAEYALRAITHMAGRDMQDGVTSQTVGEIASGTRVPLGYLSKVLQQLTKAGLIVSQRGSGGGFRLARTPQQISIYEIVNAVDPIQRIHKCPLGLKSHTELCPLHAKIDASISLMEQQFQSTTIADLILNPAYSINTTSATTNKAQCSFPLKTKRRKSAAK